MNEEINEVQTELEVSGEVEETEKEEKEIEKTGFLSRDNLYSHINVSLKFMDGLIVVLILLLVVLLIYGIFYK